MLKIPGYQVFTKIYESTNSAVYRGIRQLDHLPVIIKRLQQEYPSPEAITRYQLEYEITHSLATEQVVQAYGLQPYQHTFVLILEDFGGESLEKLMESRHFTLSEGLSLAIQMTESLDQIHAANIIHKDINPSNIVFNPTTGQLKLIDFGIASSLLREVLPFQAPTVLEGTLAYMSPEQTGRMNCPLDYRTDFYSLGATLYALLTQQQLFACTDALEIVHYHLAVQPVAPHSANADIPLAVSNIIMKLLAKMPEARYQSASGIKADLEQCLLQLQTLGHISEFALGNRDISARLQISHKLYGRDQEIATLLAAFDQARQSQQTLVLISGYSGIGKSVLVQELYKPITQLRGYFISGKFDQYQRNIPYFAIAQAFQSFIKQLLTENETRLRQWRERLLAALGANSRVIMQMVPALELIVGHQPEVPILPPTETQNRFNRVFQNFIHVFTQPEHPLVLFLDDLQWADQASLKLIQLLATTAVDQSLLLIGAYRDNEVTAAHPLMRVVEEVQQVGKEVNHLLLSPLSLPDINQLIADTLYCLPADTVVLAELVQQKTGGNPFFMNEFLKSLYTESLLTCDRTTGKWCWSMAQIQEQAITDNVVDLMSGKIQKLADQTQQVLQLAACIGNQFDLETLAFAVGLSQPKTAQALQAAIAEGLILSLSTAHKSVELAVPLPLDRPAIVYKFVHDRIQQAAYSLISAAERQQIHWQIGQSLLRKTDLDQQEQKIFDITNQLNLAKALSQSPCDRHELAQLNLRAGEKAKASTAHSSALQYFETGLELLTAHSWHDHYDLTLALYSSATEAAYLNGRLAQMEEWTAVVLEHAKTLAEKVKVYEVKIQAYAGQMQFLEAIQIGLQALAELGVLLPALPTADDIQQAFAVTASKLTGRQIEDLIHLPPMTDAIAPLIMRLLADLLAPCYQAAPPLFPLLILQMVNWSIDHGNMDLSAFGYSAYGNILSSILLDVEAGYQFGQLALDLLDHFQNPLIQCKTLFMVNTCIRFRKVHLLETIQPLQEAYQIGSDAGEIEFAGYSILHHSDHCFFTGMPLPALEQKLAGYSQALTQLKESTNANGLKVYHQTVLNLMTPSAQPGDLIGAAYDELQELPLLQQANHHKGLFYLYFNKLLLCYLFQEFPAAVDNANQAENYLDGGRSNAVFPIFYFYDSLARLALYPEATEAEQTVILQRVRSSQEKMQLWAEHAPMNYLHKWHLVAAEQYRVEGQAMAAMDAYDRAISLAKQNKYLQEEALANELAARFYLAQDRTTIAHAYLQEARYTYQRWGATAKVQALDNQYPDLITGRSQRSATSGQTPTRSSTSRLDNLDLATVLKASHAIADEIQLDRLLTKLMKTLIENAGAQTGYLILPTQDEWQIEAIGSINHDTVAVLQALPLSLEETALEADDQPTLPAAIIQYVARTHEPLVLNNAFEEDNFKAEPWIVQHQSKSILCAPLLKQGELTGIVFLENNLTTGAFTPERIEILNLLSTQAAISISNARLLKQQAELNHSLQAEIAERERVQKDRDRMIAILEATIDHVGMTDPQGNVLWQNTQARKLAGIPVDADISNYRIPNYHPQWALAIVQNQGIPAAIQDGTWVGETALLGDDGREIPVSQMIIAHKASDGSLEYISTIMRDISVLKTVETEVRQLNAELEERVLQRTVQLEATNKELEAFSYSVSHDLRAPLRHVQGFVTALRQRLESGNTLADPKVGHYLQVIDSSSQKMGHLIEGLLKLSRVSRQELTFRPVNLRALVDAAIDLVKPTSPTGGAIEFEIGDLPTVMGDTTLLQQVFVNLLSNAVKFSRVTADPALEPPSLAQINIGTLPDGTLFVQDNGVGFSMDYADKLFAAFQRLHSPQQFEGIGIGLSLVQRIIHRHGGTIWAESAPDQGATFYFTLRNIDNDRGSNNRGVVK